ncbi:MAG: FMN-binding protein [bacterium]|nr:FMN-binding protein [bacterium]
MKKIILLIISALVLSFCPAAIGAEQSALFLDEKEISGNTDIDAGIHTLTAESGSDIAIIAVYENGRLTAVSTDKTLTYKFPQSGAEIRLFSWNNSMEPLSRAVYAVQNGVQQLIYNGEAPCTPDEWGDFEEYLVRLTVVKTEGKITEIRDIEGYKYNGKPTDRTNATYLKNASKIVDKIISKQSVKVDAVSGATCASYAIMDAVEAALNSSPINPPQQTETPTSAPAAEDGVYTGSAQCLGKYINYMVDVDVTVKDGKIAGIEDKTLKQPMSSRDKEFYTKAWDELSQRIISSGSLDDIDMVSGATVSSSGIITAAENALNEKTKSKASAGEIYAPEGISLYARTYPVVTVENGKISDIRIVPANGTDTEAVEEFAEKIKQNQSIQIEYPEQIKEDAYSVASLIEQMLYGKEVLDGE